MSKGESVWMDEKTVEPDSFFKTFDDLKRKSRYRLEVDRFHNSLYHERAYQGFSDGRSLAELLSDDETLDSRLQENIILRIVSMFCAKFARQKTAPTVLTEMGDWGLQRRAMKYKRFLLGAFHQCRYYEEQRASDLHMIICGTGGIYGYSRKNRLMAEAVPPWQLFVDLGDARNGKPSTLYRQQPFPRRKLPRLYPKKKSVIEDLPNMDSSEAFNLVGDRNQDIVEVVTAWHLPSEPDMGEDTDGRVVVMARGHVLAEGPWDRPRFPIALSRYMLVPDGFFGIGAVAQLVGMQAEHNRTMHQRQISLETCSAPFIAIEKGSEVVESHMTDGIGRLIYYRGTPPTVVAPGAINPEQFNHGDRVRSAMFSNSGLSELAASSMKPAGLNSEPALRTYADMMDDSLHDVMSRRDEQTLQFSEIMLDEIESIAEENNGKFQTKYHGPFGFESIEYDEIRIDRDAVVCKVMSTSSLATTFAGRLQDVIDLDKARIPLTPAQRESLINLPDLAESSERRNSMENLLRELCEEEMLGNGNYIAPEPRWDLQLALDIVAETILQAQVRHAPSGRLEILRKFELECMAVLARMNATAPATSPGPGEMPPAIEQPPIAPEVPPPSPIAGGDMLADPGPLQ